MTKLKTWFYVFRSSLTDPSYYNDLKKSTFSFSLKYLYVLLVFLFLISGIRVAVATFVILPNLPVQVNNMKQALREDYPHGLEIKINKQGLTTNVDQPFYINFPKTRNFLGIKDRINFITINTDASVEDYPTSDTLILLTKNSAVYPDKDSSSQGTSYKVFSFSEVKEPVTINETGYSSLFVKAEPIIKVIPTFVTVFGILCITLLPLLIAGFALLGKLLYLLIMTLVILLLAKLMKKNLDYSTLYRLGMHGLTQSIIITTLLGFFGIHYAWFYTGLFIAWMIVVLNKIK